MPDSPMADDIHIRQNPKFTVLQLKCNTSDQTALGHQANMSATTIYIPRRFADVSSWCILATFCYDE